MDAVIKNLCNTILDRGMNFFMRLKKEIDKCSLKTFCNKLKVTKVNWAENVIKNSLYSNFNITIWARNLKFDMVDIFKT